MTTISLSEIPAGITTLEQLAAYSLMGLARCNPTLRVLEIPGSSVPAVEITATKIDDGTSRIITRSSLALKSDWQENATLPLFLQVDELSNTPLPAGFIQA